MLMTIRYAVPVVFLCCAAAGTLQAQQADPAQPSAGAAVASSTQPAAGTAGAEQDSALAEKVRSLRAKLHEEYSEKRESTPEEARSFREKAIALTIEYHNLLRKKPAVPMLDDARFEVHRLIYGFPHISARIFAGELGKLRKAMRSGRTAYAAGSSLIGIVER